MPQNTVALNNVVQGDRKDISIGFKKEDYDFTGVTVEAALRSPLATSPIVHTFVPQIIFPVPTDLTAFVVGLNLTGFDTNALGVGHFFGDIVVSKPDFGPYTPLQFSFDITNRITS